ncbi:MAG: hypothetical protein IJB96_04760 [Lachnospira sp.]|nr:hypothetical protein [Lachnospira sp.]
MNVRVKDIVLVGMMVAVIEVCKAAFAWIPNIELTSFWIIIFTLYLGKRTYFAMPVFILVEGAVYGINIWWIMYLYVWPLLSFITVRFRKMNSVIGWSLVSGVFGLLFGLLCSIPYIFIGSFGTDITAGFATALAWWVAGIPWDIVHGVGNFIIMLVLYHPITGIFRNLKNYLE